MNELQYLIAVAVTLAGTALWAISLSLHQIRDELRKLNGTTETKIDPRTYVETPQTRSWPKR